MFQFSDKSSDKHIEEFHRQGFTVFRNIVPAKLIDELRDACDQGVELARAKDGENAQRFQPISAYEINQKPFEEFQNLPEIQDALARIFDFPFEMSGLDVLGVLLEPAKDAWCTQWHRDWRDNISGLDIEVWEAQYRNLQMFNQVNCALYEDSCTWVVPGSHLRLDTAEEVTRFPARPVESPQLEGLSAAQRELACLEYCQSMPGATRLFLNAGDYCLYRNSLWHLGNYIPYRKRATLHDGIMTTAFREYFTTAPKIAAERRDRGILWQNPNAARLAV